MARSAPLQPAQHEASFRPTIQPLLVAQAAPLCRDIGQARTSALLFRIKPQPLFPPESPDAGPALSCPLTRISCGLVLRSRGKPMVMSPADTGPEIADLSSHHRASWWPAMPFKCLSPAIAKCHNIESLCTVRTMGSQQTTQSPFYQGTRRLGRQ